MAGKNTQLSITIATVDHATAKIRAITDRINAATKPVRDFSSALSKLKEATGIDHVINGFKAISGAIFDVISKVAVFGGAIIGGAVAGLMHLVDEYAELGERAKMIGVGVDELAQLRYAAAQTGVPVEALDEGLKAFVVNLGKAKAGTGRMAKFLAIISPELLRQVKAAKSTSEAFDLMGGAMAKLTDPAKKAALAQMAVANPELAPLLALGAKGIERLKNEYADYAGSQKEAAEAGESVHSSMLKLGAATDGLKASILVGLAPALKIIVDRLAQWFKGHKGDVTKWAAEVGEKLPGALATAADWIGTLAEKAKAFFVDAWKVIKPIVDKIEAAGGILKVAVGGSGGGSGLGAVAQKEIGEARYAAPAAVAQRALDRVQGILPDNMPVSVALQSMQADRPDVGRQLQQLFSDRAASDTTDDQLFSMLDGLGTKAASTLPQDIASAVAAAMRDVMTGAQAKVIIDHRNVPRGVRATVDPQSTADVDLSTGYSMITGGV